MVCQSGTRKQGVGRDLGVEGKRRKRLTQRTQKTQSSQGRAEKSGEEGRREDGVMRGWVFG